MEVSMQAAGEQHAQRPDPSGGDMTALPPSSDAVASLRERVAALERQPATPAGAAWKPLSMLAGIIAAVIPITTAIDGYLKWRADLDIASQQQRHAARMDSLKTVMSADMALLERESRLHLLDVIVDENDPIHAWVKDELVRVQGTLRQKTTARDTTQVEVAKLNEQLAQLEPRHATALHFLPLSTFKHALGKGDKARPPAGEDANPDSEAELQAEEAYLRLKAQRDAAAERLKRLEHSLTGRDAP
jgi:hypothetical protein